eukprot:gene2996-3183_t
MKSKISIPLNEKRRLRVLHEAEILDTGSEESYQRFTTLASRIFKAPIAVISLVDKDRLWFKARVGIPQSQTLRQSSFCARAIIENAPPVFVIPNTLKDPHFRDNPHVLDYPFIRFYAGASLEVDGVRLGTLCIIDTKVRGEDNFGEKEIAMLKDLAGIVSDMIAQRRQQNLINLHQTLHFNGKMLKLLQIPLNHIDQSKRSLAATLISLKERFRQGSSHPKENALPQQLDLLKEAKTLSREVNRFMLIIETFTRLLVEIYQLEYCQTIPDLPSTLPFINQEEVLYKTLSKMNEEDMRKELNEFYQIATDSAFNQSVKECHQYVSVEWITTPSERDRKTPTSKLIYTYPTLMKLLIMLIYDLFDYLHQSVKITIELKTKQIKEGSFVQAGQWLIRVKENDSSCACAKMEELFDFFSILSSVSNCHHVLNHFKSEVSMKHHPVYEISIPAYDFTYCQEYSIVKTLSKAICCQSSLQEECNEIIRCREKRKSPRSAPMSSFFLTPFQMIKDQWKHYRLTKALPHNHCSLHHHQKRSNRVVISPEQSFYNSIISSGVE